MTSPSIVWLFKDDQGYEDYAQSEKERDELVMIYKTAGSNYSIIELPGDEE
jgi:agmatine/peptidylarginine deiminase